jgi:uroporphyrinogen-III synthase
VNPRRPLEGLRVVVTREGGRASALGAKLTEQGAEVIYLAVLEIRDPASWRELDEAIAAAVRGSYEWIVFTSLNAVERFFVRLEHAGLEVAALATRIAAVGRATAAGLERRGLVSDLVPDEFTGEALAEALGPGTGRVLLPRVEGAPQDIIRALRDRGWRPEQVTAYRNLAVRPDSQEAGPVSAGEFDVLTFMSGSAARAFAEVLERPAALSLSPGDPPGRLVASIGPATAKAARASGFRVDLVAGDHTAGGLVDALVARFSQGGAGAVAP